MRTMLLSSVTALALFATPALAQSPGNQAGGQQQGKSAGSQQGTQIQAMTQDKLRGSLEKAGFKDVTVLDAAYLVQARSPDGDRVMMFIDPPSSGGSSASAGGTGGSATGTGSAGAVSGSGGSGAQQDQGSSNN
jgi:hypothetical protein